MRIEIRGGLFCSGVNSFFIFISVYGLENDADSEDVPHMAKLRLRAVTYREDDYWVAHSLEMDVIGVGNTEEEAVQELKGNSEAQLSFALFKGVNPFRPAPQKFQKMWDEANLSALGFKPGDRKPTFERQTRVIEWNRTQVSKFTEREFTCAH